MSDISEWVPRDQENWAIEMPPEPFCDERTDAFQAVLRDKKTGKLTGFVYKADGRCRYHVDEAPYDLVPPVEWVYIMERIELARLSSFVDYPFIQVSPDKATMRYQKGKAATTMEPYNHKENADG